MGNKTTSPEGTDGNRNLKCLNSYFYDISNDRCYSELLDVLSESNCPHEGGQAILLIRNGQQLANQIFQGLEFIHARYYLAN